ncbi:hypothetical protein [Dyadobacter fermentans]|uniref:hypothetical protein n=1 Tax=Dyadobacter fermentans TaxID=94254 RepID=UPI001CBB2D08|nr:hypothetical protein [Dyadobacter fermentans]MBZ1359988.1 hypothetical protein [Dyadobacter fermentans]
MKRLILLALSAIVASTLAVAAFIIPEKPDISLVASHTIDSLGAWVSHSRVVLRKASR